MTIPAWRRYLRFWRTNIDADIDDELRFHMDERVEDLMARGRSREAAQQEALEEFGQVSDVRAELHEIDERRLQHESRASRWEAAWQDTRYAVRNLVSNRGVALTVIITLALGLGANAAMFTFLNTLLLRPPDGLAQPGQLHRLWARHLQTFDHVPSWAAAFSYPDFQAMARATAGEATLAAYWSDDKARLGPTDDFPRVSVGYATHDLLPLLGARLRAGRLFSGDEDRMGAGARVAVVSYAFAQRHFDDDAGVLGQSLQIGKQRYTVVGVMRPEFSGIDLNAVDVWIPLASMPAQWYNNEWYRTRNFQLLEVVARTASDASARRAEAIVTGVLRTPVAEGPPADTLETAQLGSIIRARGPWTPDHDVAIALRLSGVAVVVLLIAIANVINLLLARASRRRREFALRLALGMSRRRLGAMLCIETTLLALAAGVGATLVAIWGGLLLRTLLMPDTHFAAPVFDWRVGAATIAITLLVGLVTGLLPASQAGRVDLTASLKAGSRAGHLQRSRLRPALLVMQSALAILLLAAAGALIRSLHKVETLRLGFDVDHIVYAEVPERRETLLRSVEPDLMSQIRALPGVEHVATANMAPMRGFAATMMYMPGRASLVFPHAQPVFTAVSPEYFATTGMRILRGRSFQKDGTGEVVVSSEFARTVWPNDGALGKCVIFDKRGNPCSTVVGVVENPHHWELTEEPWPEYYLPLDHMPVPGYAPSTIIARTSPDRAPQLAGEMRRMLHDAFPQDPPTVTVMKDIVAPQFHSWRLAAELFSAFAVLALCIAAIGVYSTLSYTTGQRTHEIGVRMALGAQVRDVVRLVLVDGLALVAIGIVIGMACVVGVGRVLAALLYETSARDPITIALTAATLLAAAAIAAALPARRAAQVNPVSALRVDA